MVMVLIMWGRGDYRHGGIELSVVGVIYSCGYCLIVINWWFKSPFTIQKKKQGTFIWHSWDLTAVVDIPMLINKKDSEECTSPHIIRNIL